LKNNYLYKWIKDWVSIFINKHKLLL